MVGVDGSVSSKRALLRAVRQARATGAAVEAVICWPHPTMYERAPMSVDRELGHAAGRLLLQAVEDAVRRRWAATSSVPGP